MTSALTRWAVGLAIFCSLTLISGNDAYGSDIFAEHFNSGSIDSRLWTTIVDPLHGQVGIVDGSLEIQFTDNFFPNSASIESTFRIHGNFEAIVDYQLMDWPSAQHRCGMGFTYSAVERTHDAVQGSGENYVVDACGWPYPYIPTTDMSGRLRLVREGTAYTGYYAGSDGGWNLIGTDYCDAAIIPLSLSLWTGYTYSAPVTVRLDNLFIRADQIEIPPPGTPGNPPAPPFADDFAYDYSNTGDCYTNDHPCPDTTYFPCALSPNKYWKKVSWLWEHRNKQGRLTGLTAILPENVTTDPDSDIGELVISAGEFYQPPLGCPSAPEQTGTGGGIESSDESSERMFRYGSFRANIKASRPASNNGPISLGKGVVNGFFYYREGHGEIDVEILSQEQGTDRGVIQFAVHDLRQGRKSKGISHPIKFPPHEAYHIYGFDWYADRVEFWVDDQIAEVIYSKDIAIPSLAGKLILNNWSGGDGAPPGENLEMRVDWVSYTP